LVWLHALDSRAKLRRTVGERAERYLRRTRWPSASTTTCDDAPVAVDNDGGMY
jgi:hypothetical protein